MPQILNPDFRIGEDFDRKDRFLEEWTTVAPDFPQVAHGQLEIATSGGATVLRTDQITKDGEFYISFKVPTDLNSYRAIVARRLSVSDGKMLMLAFHGNGRLVLYKVNSANSATQLAEYTGLKIAVDPNERYWISCRFDKNTIKAKLFIADPFLEAKPTYEFTHALAAGDLVDYGEAVQGYFGVRLFDGVVTESGIHSFVGRGLDFVVADDLTFTPISIPKPLWKFILAESETLNPLADVSYARSKNLGIINDKAGSCSFTVPVDHEDWETIDDGVHCIIAYRKGVPIWSGPIWNIKEALPDNQMQVNAVGWYETLLGRFLRRDLAVGTQASPVIPGEIVMRLLDEINTKQREHYTQVNNQYISTAEIDAFCGAPSSSYTNPWFLTTTVGPTTFNIVGQVFHSLIALPKYSLFPYGRGSMGIYPGASTWNSDNYHIEILYDTPGFGQMTVRFMRHTTLIGGLNLGFGPIQVRLREASGTLFGEYSINGVDWITIASTVPGFSLSSVRFFHSAYGGDNNPPTNTNTTYFVVNLFRVGDEEKLQPSYIGRGTQADNSAARFRQFKNHDNIQALINNQVDVENGIDFLIHPTSRLMMTLPGSLQVGDSRIKDDVVFGFNWGPRNIMKFDRESDFSVFRNRFTAQGKYGSAIQEDLVSQAAYNILMEEHAQLSEVVDINTLKTYVAGEVALRATPRRIVSFIPFPWTEDSSVPQPFVDYNVGDRVRLSAVFGKRIKIDNFPVRIFGINVDINDDGNERISSLQVSP